jgi:hypothetical protein
MPTVLLINGYRFYFYINEHEPIHVHVSKAGKEARFVLIPAIDLSNNRGFKRSEIREIVNLLIQHYDTLVAAWRNTFDQ